MLDQATFERLHAASTTCDDNIVVAAADVRSLLDAAAEIDRQCAAMTRELADAKGRLIEVAGQQGQPAA